MEIFAIGGSVGGTAGVAGSFSVTVIDDTTQAYIKSPGSAAKGSITATNGDVNVVARSNFGLIRNNFV